MGSLKGQVRDVHTRVVRAPLDTVAALLDRIGGEDDPLFPTPVWPPMRFDRPLGVGADGGHGFVRYRVSAYEPGRRIRFDFTDGSGGFHEIRIRALDAERCHVEHALEQRFGAGERLLWEAVIKAVHGAVVEEMLDNVERAATGAVSGAPFQRPLRVRLFNRLTWPRARAVDLPAEARLARAAFPRTDFQDAWQLEIQPGMPERPEAWQGVLRGAFPVLGRDHEDREILLGKDARHLDFRASVLVADGRVTLGTVVRTHHAGGRLYFALVRRVHPLMVRLMLRRTHRRLALAAPSAGEREWNRVR
ncbi:DUF2867 domain-containing protein [Streptomyces sp. NPDC048172]|uniref:DUF2867 domain-containing protein n=1 Tax=Streptomyces sp. NPDC048172 TaxID=3365505 RepID=UPI003717B73F